MVAANAEVRANFDISPVGDADGDGLPNSWETQYGLNPTSSSDALIDTDGDGWTNIAEYNRNTNPTTRDVGTTALGNEVPGGWPLAGVRPGYAVGTTKGQASVDKSGAFSYTIPLWTTPGTAGMEPKISLNYSSQSGLGVAGLGWSLGGISTITRGPRTKAIDGVNQGVTLTANDRFYLDGQRLLVISGTYGASSSEYRTEFDSLTKVVAQGMAGSGPAWFKAWTKSGLVLEFGNTSDSAFDAVGKQEKLSWHINKITDTLGNYIVFVYDEDTTTGSHRISRINYSGSGQAAPYASLRFGYEDRADEIYGYIAGSPVYNQKRLKHIVSYFGETVARTYTLSYEIQAHTSRSLLASVTEYGADSVPFPSLIFDYETNDWGWTSEQSAYTPPHFLADNSNSGRPAGSGFVDLDADGRVDFVARRDSGVNIAKRNTGSGWADFTTANFLLPYKLADTAKPDDVGSRFADLNGDGRADYIWRAVGTSGNSLANGVVLSSETGWTSTGSNGWGAPTTIAKDGDSLRSARLLDVDGDGLVDFVSQFNADASSSGTNLAVYLNTGSGWAAKHVAYSTMPTDLATSRARFIELNGDGLVDIVSYYHGSGTTIRKTYLNSGTGWIDTPSYYLPQLIADNVNFGLGAEFVDVNADGLPDLIWYREIGSGHQRGVALNTGAGWYVGREATVPAFSGEPLDPLDPPEVAVFNRYAPPSPLGRDSV